MTDGSCVSVSGPHVLWPTKDSVLFPLDRPNAALTWMPVLLLLYLLPLLSPGRSRKKGTEETVAGCYILITASVSITSVPGWQNTGINSTGHGHAVACSVIYPRYGWRNWHYSKYHRLDNRLYFRLNSVHISSTNIQSMYVAYHACPNILVWIISIWAKKKKEKETLANLIIENPSQTLSGSEHAYRRYTAYLIIRW